MSKRIFFNKNKERSRLKRSVFFLSLFISVLLFIQCAKVVAPAGGPKDIDPPVLIKSTPLPFSTHFAGKKVVLTFDEFIQVPTISQKLIVSPPQKEPLTINLKGKSIELVFKEELIDSTTYTLYFSDAIADNNEGNKILNFEFAFSTGSTIDSLTFSGKLIDAQKLEPQEGVLVMLYNSMEDTLPLTTRPMYISKTNKTGDFYLSNLKEGIYKIFALTDLNSNYIFDQASEAIAFRQEPIIKSMLKPRQEKPLETTEDSVESEPLKIVELRLFMEENRVHSLTDYSRDSRRRLRFGFTRKPETSPIIVPFQGTSTNTDWYILEKNFAGDTLTYWITDSQISSKDSLQMIVTYGKTDTLLNIIEFTDTLRFIYTDPVKEDSRRKKKTVEEPEKIPTLPVSFSFKKGSRPTIVERLRVNFSMPLLTIDTTKLSLSVPLDSTIVTGFKVRPDSLNPRLYWVDFPWMTNTSYIFTAFPGAFINLDGLVNDTTSITFTGADPETFGTLNLSLKGLKSPVIVELLSDKGEMVDKKNAIIDQLVPFKFILPGKYSFRFIIDNNGNGKWDTGWYIKGIQPERVIIFEENGKPKIFDVRANWEYDVEYDFSLTE